MHGLCLKCEVCVCIIGCMDHEVTEKNCLLYHVDRHDEGVIMTVGEYEAYKHL